MEYRHTIKTLCKFCKQEFDSFALAKVCSECEASMEDNFRKMDDYICKFPDHGVSEIHEALGFSVALIKHYLRERKIKLMNDSRNYFPRCQSCGKAITFGRYCFDCEIEVTRRAMSESIKGKRNENTTTGDALGFHATSYVKFGKRRL